MAISQRAWVAAIFGIAFAGLALGFSLGGGTQRPVEWTLLGLGIAFGVCFLFCFFYIIIGGMFCDEYREVFGSSGGGGGGGTESGK